MMTESEALAALRKFLMFVVPAGVEVVRGQDNRVPVPKGDNYIVMTPILREQIETSIREHTDGAFAVPATAGQASITQPLKLTVQVDFFGAMAADYATTAMTLYRDLYAVEAFAGTGAFPLYCDMAKQVPFHNEHQQIEYRWSIDFCLQYNATVTVVQDFADQLQTQVVEVDAEYPPQ